MKSLLILFFILTSLFGDVNDYYLCKKKFQDSSFNNTFSVLLENNLRVSTKKLPLKLIRYDKFLSLYLYEDSVKFKYPFKLNPNFNKPLAFVNFTDIYEVKRLKKQIGLDSFAKFSKKVNSDSVVVTSCCFLDALATKNGVIELPYIKHFIYKGGDYFDIGIRVDSFAKVTQVDPFFKNNRFKLLDKILKVSSYKVEDGASLMQKILFNQNSYKVTLKRDNKIKTFIVTPAKRYGGGYISDTFLERFGLFFSKDLVLIKNIDNRFGLLKGDKLLKVNGFSVKNYKDVRDALSYTKDGANLLFLRDGFEFFVKII